MCKNLKDIIKFYRDIIWHYSIVILGFRPRIHEKQPLSRHYRACPDNLDPRNKSEDDYKKKMIVKPEDDNRKRMCAILEDDKQCGLTKDLEVVRQCAVLLERRVQSSTRVRKVQTVTRQTNPIGRSMIEMLGVLAIIGVLSVGGIAGYSKAMMKIKINRLIDEYSFVFQGLMEYMPRMQGIENGQGYVDLLIALNLVPQSWKKVTSTFIEDSLGNALQLRVFDKALAFEVYLSSYNKVYTDNAQSQLLCLTLIDTVLKPLSNFVDSVYVWRGGAQTQNQQWYGNKQCIDDRKCLRDITLTDIDKQCKSCTIDNDRSCSVVFSFLRY